MFHLSPLLNKFYFMIFVVVDIPTVSALVWVPMWSRLIICKAVDRGTIPIQIHIIKVGEIILISLGEERTTKATTTSRVLE